MVLLVLHLHCVQLREAARRFFQCLFTDPECKMYLKFFAVLQRCSSLGSYHSADVEFLAVCLFFLGSLSVPASRTSTSCLCAASASKAATS